MNPSGPFAMLGSVLANRALRRVLVSYLAFNIAESATWVAILLYAYAQTGPASVGLVALIQLMPAALIATPAATLGDRFPRQRVLTAGYLAQAVAMLATGAAMAGGAPVWLVYAAAAVTASSLVVTRPTQAALLPSLSRTPDELTAANGAAGFVEGIGLLIGPLVAAAVVIGSTSAAVFLVGGAALVLGAIATIRLHPVGGLAAVLLPDVGSDGMPGSAEPRDDSFLAGIRAVAADPDARLVVGIMTVRMIILGAADILFVLMAIDLLGLGEPGAGVLTGALGAGTMAGGALMFALVGRTGLAWVTAAGAAVWGAGLALIGLTGFAAVAPLLIVVAGAGLTLVDVAGRTMLQRSIRDAVLARVFGLQEGLAMAGLAAGSVLVSVIVGVADLGWAIALAAILLPVVVLVAWPRLTALDRRAVAPLQAILLLRSTALFAPLPMPQLEAVARRGTWLTMPSGATIIREGDPGDRYYVLASGHVRVEQGGALLRTLDRAGAGFGEIALLQDVPRTATVTATSDLVAFAIDRAAFLAAVTGHPDAFAAAQRSWRDDEQGSMSRPPQAREPMPGIEHA